MYSPHITVFALLVGEERGLVPPTEKCKYFPVWMPLTRMYTNVTRFLPDTQGKGEKKELEPRNNGLTDQDLLEV